MKMLFIDSALCGTPERTVNVQIVRVVIAGGLLRSTEGLLQATTHKQPRQQAAALAPIRFPLNLLCLERHQCDLCLSCILPVCCRAASPALTLPPVCSVPAYLSKQQDTITV